MVKRGHRNLSHFKRVFLRNELKHQKPKIKDCGTVNLGNDIGTYWTTYHRNKNILIFLLIQSTNNKKGNRLSYTF